MEDISKGQAGSKTSLLLSSVGQRPSPRAWGRERPVGHVWARTLVVLGLRVILYAWFSPSSLCVLSVSGAGSASLTVMELTGEHSKSRRREGAW